jgi:hypothetical protein
MLPARFPEGTAATRLARVGLSWRVSVALCRPGVAGYKRVMPRNAVMPGLLQRLVVRRLDHLVKPDIYRKPARSAVFWILQDNLSPSLPEANAF